MGLYVNDGVKVYEPDLDALVGASWKGRYVVTGGVVAAQGVPAMSVQVSAGTIMGDALIAAITATNPLAIGVADATNPRIDVVSVPIAGGIPVVTGGVAASVPKPPALPAASVLLAYVSVAAAAVNIQSSNITDRRQVVGMQRVAAVDILADRPSATDAGRGALYVDTTNNTIYVSNGTSWTNPSTFATVVRGTAGGVFSGAVGNGTAGVGVEVGASGGVGVIQSYDRTGAAYATLAIDASTILLRPGGTTAISVAAGVITVGAVGTATSLTVLGAASWIGVANNAAVSGVLRVPFQGDLTSRNEGNTGDVGLIRLHTNNVIRLGDGTASATGVNISMSGNENLSFGTLSATTGQIRMPNGGGAGATGAIYFRNGANTANNRAFWVDSSDRTWVETVTGSDVVLAISGNGKLHVNGNGALLIGTLTAGGLTTAALQICSSGPLIYSGSGAPTISAAVKGSLYLRTDGSSTSTRMYVATDAAGGWTAVTTAS